MMELKLIKLIADLTASFWNLLDEIFFSLLTLVNEIITGITHKEHQIWFKVGCFMVIFQFLTGKF